MDITFLILFGLSVLVSNAMFNAVKDELVKGEDKKMTQKTVTLDEFLNERGDFVKQVVYKIDGDYVGDIKGKNVTVILMGDGNFRGDINSKDGTVFLNKGNVIGDIKADKVLCPTKPEETSEKQKGTYRGKEFCSCYDCAHCHFRFEAAHCSFKNKVIRGVTPCTNFEWRCKYDH